MRMNNRGQALVEYVLIITLITVVAISLIKIFGGYLKDSMTKTSCSLVNKAYVEGKDPGLGRCVDQDVADEIRDREINGNDYIDSIND